MYNKAQEREGNVIWRRIGGRVYRRRHKKGTWKEEEQFRAHLATWLTTTTIWASLFTLASSDVVPPLKIQITTQNMIRTTWSENISTPHTIFVGEGANITFIKMYLSFLLWQNAILNTFIFRCPFVGSVWLPWWRRHHLTPLKLHTVQVKVEHNSS